MNKSRKLVRKMAAVIGCGLVTGATVAAPVFVPAINVYAADNYDTEKKDYDTALTNAKKTPNLRVTEEIEKVTVYESEAEAKKNELATKIDAETAKLNAEIEKTKAANEIYKQQSSDPDFLLKDKYNNQEYFPKENVIEFLTDKKGNFDSGINELKFSDATAFSSTANRITKTNDIALLQYYIDRDGNGGNTEDRFNRGLEFSGSKIDLTTVDKNNYFYMAYTPRKGDTFTWENVFTDADSGKDIDLIWTLEDFEVIEGVATPTLFIAPKAGIDIYSGLKTVTFDVQMVEHGTNTPVNADVFYLAVDVDCNQYEVTVDANGNTASVDPQSTGGQALTIYGADKIMLPVNLTDEIINEGVVEGKKVNGGYMAIGHTDDNTTDKDPNAWCAFILRDKSSFKIKWDDLYSNSLKTHANPMPYEEREKWLEAGKTNSRTYAVWEYNDQLLARTDAWVAFAGMNFNWRNPEKPNNKIKVKTYELEVLPDPQKATVTYIDKTTNKELEKKALDGVSRDPFNYNTTDTIKKYTDKGYKLVSSDYPANEADQKFDSDPKTDQAFTVILEHNIVNIPPDKPGYGISEDQLNKTIKRTIFYKYTNKDGKDVYEPVTQTVHLTRSAKKDLVTGETTFTAWTEGKMEEVVTKPKTNYTHDKDKVDGVDPVKVDTKVDDEYVIFNKIPQKGSVSFVDKKNETIAEKKTLKGYNAEPFNYTPDETIKGLQNKGWDLVSNDFPKEAKEQVYDTDSSKDQDYTVVMTPHIEKIPPDNPKNPGDPTGRTDVPYPDGLKEKDLNKTLTRTIYYKYNNAEGEDVFEPVKQTVKLTRSATFNYVTGEVTYSEWTVGKIEDVASPKKANYTLDRAIVEGVPEVTTNTKLEDQYVIYKKIPQKGSVTFTDRDSKNPIADTKKLNGYQAEPFNYTPDATIQKLTDGGYDLVSNDFPADAKDQVYDKDTKVDQDYSVVMTPHIETITPDNPKKPGDNTGRKDVDYPEGLEAKNLNKTLTRTIYYKYNNKDGEDAFAPVKQSVKLTRKATFNYVTKEVKYGKWTTSSIEDVKSPDKENYTYDRTVVEGVQEITVDTKLEDQYVIYKKIPQKGSVDFTDRDTKQEVEAKKELNGYQAEPFNYTPDSTIKKLENNGYDLVSNDFPEDPKDQVYDKDTKTDQDFHVVLTPHIEIITPDNPKAPESPTGRENVKYPEGLDEADLNKTFKRTIFYKYDSVEGEDVFEPVEQTVTLTRTATFNYVTGEVIYGNWTTEEIADVESGTIAHWQFDKAVVEGVSLTSESEPLEDVYVIYTRIPEKGKVEFTDEADKPIADTHELNGFDEDPFDYDPKPTLDELHNKGWDLISNDYPADEKDQVFDSDPDTDQDFKIVHTPHIEDITHDNPKKPGSDTDRKDVKYPEGLDEADLNKTFTRTVYFKYTDKNGENVFEPVKQTVTLTRDAKFNYVTGEIEYTEWTTDTFAAVDAKTKEGYTFDRSKVDELVLTGDSEAPADEYIIYTAKPVETPKTSTPVTSTPSYTGSVTPSTNVTRTSGTSTGDSSKTGLFAAIGVGAAAAIGSIAAFLRKRGKSEDEENA